MQINIPFKICSIEQQYFVLFHVIFMSFIFLDSLLLFQERLRYIVACYPINYMGFKSCPVYSGLVY